MISDLFSSMAATSSTSFATVSGYESSPVPTMRCSAVAAGHHVDRSVATLSSSSSTLGGSSYVGIAKFVEHK
jgi:hypothetical protein